MLQNSGTISSEEAVSKTVRDGLFGRLPFHMGVGFFLGGIASLLVTRSGSVSRKVILGFGGGAGIGSAWTKTNIDLEQMLLRDNDDDPSA